MGCMCPPRLPDRPAFSKAFITVSIAEIFDKTWFVTLFMATSYSKLGSLISSYAALAAHTFIAAGLGIAVSKIAGARISALHFIAAGVMLLYAVWHAYEAWAKTDIDMVAEAKADVDEEFKTEEGTSQQRSPGSTVRGEPKRFDMMREARGGLTIFTAVFVAEWADRTQVFMVALQASQTHWPVIMGALEAFLLLSISAVLLESVVPIVAMLRISKRTANIVIAISFLVFMGLSIVDGMSALALEIPHSKVWASAPWATTHGRELAAPVDIMRVERQGQTQGRGCVLVDSVVL